MNNIIKDTKALMSQAKASRRRGWAMSKILKDIEKKHDKAGAKTARDWIVKDYCKIEEKN